MKKGKKSCQKIIISNSKKGDGYMFDFERYSTQTALIDDEGNSVSYEDLSSKSKSLIKNFEPNRKCLVFCLCSNTIGSVVGYTSFLNGHFVPLLLGSNIDTNLLFNLIEAYRPEYLYSPENQKDKFNDFVEVYGADGYSLLATGYKDDYQINNDLALLLTTSGSTGSPKFVRQSYENIKANTDSIIKYLELDSTERPITTLPMNYTYGLSIINTHLSVGATMLLTDKSLIQKEFWQFLKEREATSFGGVPYTYEMLDKLRFYKMDLPYLRTMTQAGGKLIPELHEKFAKYAKENGKKFVVMYGQCEATARMGYLPAEKALEKKGSMGIAIPGGTFKLIDADGEEIHAPHTTGELVYKGANVTLGYAEQSADLAKGDERHGILQTGDMAQFDEDGFYYIVGRKKRFLKIYGNRVNLDEMERLIKGEFEVEVACAGVDDHMYIFLTDKEVSSHVKDYVVKTTKLNPAAFNVKIIDEIPKNDSGKTKYVDLEKYYDV